MRFLAQHRTTVVAASAVALLSAATVAPVAVSAASVQPLGDDEVVTAASWEEGQDLTASAYEAIEKREQAATAAARKEAREKRAAKQEARAAKQQEKKRAQAAEQASRSAARAAADPRSLASAMAAERYGWGADQFQCLSLLWEKESNWNHTAQNPSSGAYGIPQSLPGSKMASHGADWQTNPATQISWGLDYISERYGTPCGAWGHSQSVGWY